MVLRESIEDSAATFQLPDLLLLFTHLGQRLGDVLQTAGDGAEVRPVVHDRRPALRHQLLQRRRHLLPEPAKTSVKDVRDEWLSSRGDVRSCDRRPVLRHQLFERRRHLPPESARD